MTLKTKKNTAAYALFLFMIFTKEVVFFSWALVSWQDGKLLS